MQILTRVSKRLLTAWKCAAIPKAELVFLADCIAALPKCKSEIVNCSKVISSKHYKKSAK